MSDIGFKPDFRLIGEPKPIDIVERLRSAAQWGVMTSEFNKEDRIEWEAADEIESLREENEQLKELWGSDQCVIAERDELREEKELLLRSIDGYSAQLAAAQARIAELEAGLRVFCNCKNEDDLLRMAILAIKLLQKGVGDGM